MMLFVSSSSFLAREFTADSVVFPWKRTSQYSRAANSVCLRNSFESSSRRSDDVRQPRQDNFCDKSPPCRSVASSSQASLNFARDYNVNDDRPSSDKPAAEVSIYLYSAIRSRSISNILWAIKELRKRYERNKHVSPLDPTGFPVGEILGNTSVLDYGLWKAAVRTCFRYSGRDVSAAMEVLMIGEQLVPQSHVQRATYIPVVSALAHNNDWKRVLTLVASLWSRRQRNPEAAPDEQFVVFAANLAVNAGRVDVAKSLFAQMRAAGVPLNAFSFSVLFKGFGREKNIAAVRRTFDEMRQMHVEFDRVCFNSAVDALVRCGEIGDARSMVYRVNYKNLRDVRTFNILLKFFAYSGNVNAAFDVRDEIITAGFVPNEVTLNILVNACVQAGDFSSAIKLAESIRPEYMHSEKSSTKRGEDGSHHSRRSSNSRLSRKNEGVNQLTIALSRILSGLADAGRLRQAIRLLDNMEQRGAPPNYITYCALINACMRQSLISPAQAIFHSMKEKTGVSPTVEVFNAMITGLCKSENEFNVDSALRMLKQMRERVSLHEKGHNRESSQEDLTSTRGSPTLIACEDKSEVIRPSNLTYNSVIDGLVQFNRVHEAEEVFGWMRNDGVRPTVVTFTTLIKGWSNEREFGEVHRVFQSMSAEGIFPDVQALNSYLNACLRLGKVESASVVLDVLEKDLYKSDILPDAYSYTPFIAHEIRLGNLENAWSFYQRGRQHGIRINAYLADLLVHAVTTLGVVMVSPGKAIRRKAVADMAVTILDDVWEDLHEKNLVRPWRRQLLAFFSDYPDCRERIAKSGGSGALRSASEKIFERHGWNEISSGWRTL